MKILIINNSTSYLSQLKNLLFGYVCQVVKYTEIDSVNTNNFNAIILSGGHNFPVNGNEKKLQKEVDILRKRSR